MKQEQLDIIQEMHQECTQIKVDLLQMKMWGSEPAFHDAVRRLQELEDLFDMLLRGIDIFKQNKN